MKCMVPDLKHVSVSFERQLDGYLSRRMQQLQFGLQRIRIILITRLPDICIAYIIIIAVK